MGTSYKLLSPLLSVLLSVLLMAAAGTASMPSAVIAAEQPIAAAVSADAQSELLVQYTDLPSSVPAVPSLPAGTEEAAPIAPSVKLLTFDNPEDCEKAAAALSRNPLVETVEPNYERSADAVSNDPYYASQWWLNDVKAPVLWSLAGRQAKSAVVAVIDTGLDTADPDFKGRVAPGAYNFVDANTDVQDTNGHGTSVSGVIGSALNNGYGIAGTAGPFDVKILPLKTVRPDGKGTVAMNVQAIDYAIRQHVDVINISQGGTAESAIEQEAVQRAADAGILIVASAGNEAEKGNPVMYPAAYSQVLSVASIGKQGSRSAFSVYNAQVDLSAPGEGIVTNWPGGKIVSMSGTSFSAPIAAAAAAMVRSTLPGLAPDAVKQMLMDTAEDLGAPGRDPLYGAGMLDMGNLSVSLNRSLETTQAVRVSGVRLDQPTMSLAVGNPATKSSARLTAHVLPENAANQSVRWSSSDPRIAAVDQNGAVTAAGKGRAVITATTADGGFTASAVVTVTAIAPFTGDFPDMEIDDTKVFAVKFNTALRKDFDYTDYIRISTGADGTGQVMGTVVQTDPADPHMLYIANPGRWAKGTFYLTIRKGLPADSGKLLNRDTKLKFTVR